MPLVKSPHENGLDSSTAPKALLCGNCASLFLCCSLPPIPPPLSTHTHTLPSTESINLGGSSPRFSGATAALTVGCCCPIPGSYLQLRRFQISWSSHCPSSGCPSLMFLKKRAKQNGGKMDFKPRG